METFSASLALLEGNPPVTDGFPLQKQVTRNFDVYFDLCLNKRVDKQSRRRRFGTPSRSPIRQCDGKKSDILHLNARKVIRKAYGMKMVNLRILALYCSILSKVAHYNLVWIMYDDVIYIANVSTSFCYGHTAIKSKSFARRSLIPNLGSIH